MPADPTTATLGDERIVEPDFADWCAEPFGLDVDSEGYPTYSGLVRFAAEHGVELTRDDAWRMDVEWIEADFEIPAFRRIFGELAQPLLDAYLDRGAA